MMTSSRVRSTLLFLLVLLSLVISYSIWHGDWLNRSEAGFADTTTAGTMSTNSPILATVEQPYQIVLQSGQPGVEAKFSVQQPGTTAYDDWLQRLADLSINGLKPALQSSADTASKTVQIEFGSSVERTDLQQLVPSLRNAAFADGIQTITLYQMSDGHAVMMELSSTGEPDVYTGRTDINPAEFSHLLTAAVTENPWLPWNLDTQSFLPQKPQELKQYRWTTHSPSVIALVHSFFVNPGALTRIQEQGGQVLWTDGSRAIQWNATAGMLIFDDPNAASAGGPTTNRLAVALSFIRNHGGGPVNLLAYSEDTQSTNRNATTYVLRPVVDGLPVLENSTAFEVTLNAGHVTAYQRPTTDQAVGAELSKVKTMSGDALLTIIQKQLKLPDVKTWMLSYGYAVIPAGHGRDVLEPVVILTSPSGQQVEVNAVNGRLMKGSGAS